MYDASGNKILTVNISPPDVSDVWVLTAAAGSKGGVLAAAAGATTDGRRGFIARTDNAGRTVQWLMPEHFNTKSLCEAGDTSVWVLGQDGDAPGIHDFNNFVVRQYSFEKGLISRFVIMAQVENTQGESNRPPAIQKTYLRCGADRVSAFLPDSSQYAEIDTATATITRWKVDMSSAVGPESRGFAVTKDLRVFVAFANSDHAHQLYELRAMSGNPVATLTPVIGMLSTVDPIDDASKYTVTHLLGADGNDLIVQRQGDRWGVSWVKVIPSSSPPD
jgi:hypothetical protein